MPPWLMEIMNCNPALFVNRAFPKMVLYAFPHIFQMCELWFLKFPATMVSWQLEIANIGENWPQMTFFSSWLFSPSVTYLLRNVVVLLKDEDKFELF